MMINQIRLWYKRFTGRWMLRASYCKHCGVDIRDFIVSDEVWEQVAPHIKHGHTLCYNCFSDICLEIGLPSVWSLFHNSWPFIHAGESGHIIGCGIPSPRSVGDDRCKVMLLNNAGRCPRKAVHYGNCRHHGGGGKRRVAQVVFAESHPFDAESLRRCKQVLDFHRRINDNKRQ